MGHGIGMHLIDYGAASFVLQVAYDFGSWAILFFVLYVASLFLKGGGLAYVALFQTIILLVYCMNYLSYTDVWIFILLYSCLRLFGRGGSNEDGKTIIHKPKPYTFAKG